MRFPQFTRDYILALTRKSDVYQYDLWSSPPQRETRLQAAVTALNSPAFKLGLLKVTEFRGKQMFMPQTYEDKLYIRHLSYRIRTAYRAHAPNRDSIVEQVGHLLKCDTQLQILRTDIRRFFQSIPFQELIDSIQLEGLLRSSEIRVFRTIFDQMTAVGQRGLPWGLSLSSPLAELFMRAFDQACRRITGVIYYQRFVDDIIIFSALPVSEVEDALRVALHRVHPDLRLNSGKTFQISEIQYPPASPSSFHYWVTISSESPQERMSHSRYLYRLKSCWVSKSECHAQQQFFSGTLIGENCGTE